MGKGNCGHCAKELKYRSGVVEVMLDPMDAKHVSHLDKKHYVGNVVIHGMNMAHSQKEMMHVP